MAKTTMPAHPDDLHCDTCTNIYPFRGTTISTRDLARVNGWHLHPGPPLLVLCPECVGTPRTRLPKVVNFTGQADIFEDLGINPESLEQRERRGD
jgi:hypothetical protein